MRIISQNCMLFLCIIVLVVSGCVQNNNSTEQTNQKSAQGSSSDTVSGDIGTDGGNLYVTDTKSPISGVGIRVAKDILLVETTINISSAPKIPDKKGSDYYRDKSTRIGGESI